MSGQVIRGPWLRGRVPGARRIRGDDGVATVTGAALIAALLVVTAGLLHLGGAIGDRHRAQTAADLAALAAASAPGGADCAVADRIARANGAQGVQCAPWQGDVVVRVEVAAAAWLRGLGLGPATAIARAGPAE